MTPLASESTLSGLTLTEWRQFAEIVNAIRASEQKLHRPATRAEIAAEIGLSPEAYRSLIMQLGKVSNPFLAAGPDAVVRFLDLAPGQTNASIIYSASEPQVVSLIANTIDAMPLDESVVLALCFHEQLTPAEISAIVKLDIESVFYLHLHGIFRLRSCLTYNWPTLKLVN